MVEGNDALRQSALDLLPFGVRKGKSRSAPAPSL
jgi:hypothetical protein